MSIISNPKNAGQWWNDDRYPYPFLDDGGYNEPGNTITKDTNIANALPSDPYSPPMVDPSYVDLNKDSTYLKSDIGKTYIPPFNPNDPTFNKGFEPGWASGNNLPNYDIKPTQIGEHERTWVDTLEGEVLKTLGMVGKHTEGIKEPFNNLLNTTNIVGVAVIAGVAWWFLRPLGGK